MRVDSFIREVMPHSRSGRINMPQKAVSQRFIVLPEKYRFEVEAILEREPTSLGSFLTSEEVGAVRFSLMVAINEMTRKSKTAQRLRGYHRDLEILQAGDVRKMVKHIDNSQLRQRLAGFLATQENRG